VASLLYFIPNETRPLLGTTPERLPPAIRAVLDGRGWAYTHAVRGPSVTDSVGPGGAVLAIQPGRDGVEAKCGYYPDEQCWEPIDDTDGNVLYWVGWEKERPPTPEDLSRNRAVDWDGVELADGKRWPIPLVHPTNTTLPQRARMRRGQLVFDVESRYEWICRTVERVLDGDGGEPTWQEVYDLCAALLGVCSVLGPAEVSALGLLRRDHFYAVLRVATGHAALEAHEAAKKKGD